jgi:hypothetical protein
VAGECLPFERNRDGVVAVEALLSAVAAALDGCPVDTVRFHAVSLKGKKVLAALAQPWG